MTLFSVAVVGAVCLLGFIKFPKKPTAIITPMIMGQFVLRSVVGFSVEATLGVVDPLINPKRPIGIIMIPTTSKISEEGNFTKKGRTKSRPPIARNFIAFLRCMDAPVNLTIKLRGRL